MTGKCVVVLSLAMFARPAGAQDLEPRAYSAAPIGLNFVLAGYTYSTGDVLLDPTLPLTDVKATVNGAVAGFGRTFSLFGRTALAVVAQPYAVADVSGRIGEQAASTRRSGLADTRIKLSMNFLGGRALKPRDFARAPRSTILGASIALVPPIGQYYPARLINLGSNRWAFRPEVGISKPIGHWTVDAYGGVWLFTSNDQFYTGTSHRRQEPIFAAQGHMSYTWRQRLWTAFDVTWYTGGTTTIDDVGKADLVRNARGGATLSLPLGAQQQLKVAYSGAISTRIGGTFRTIGAAWQFSWLDRAPSRP